MDMGLDEDAARGIELPCRPQPRRRPWGERDRRDLGVRTARHAGSEVVWPNFRTRFGSGRLRSQIELGVAVIRRRLQDVVYPRDAHADARSPIARVMEDRQRAATAPPNGLSSRTIDPRAGRCRSGLSQHRHASCVA